MLSIAARSFKSAGFKPVVGSLTAVRTKVTLPELPYEYGVSILPLDACFASYRYVHCVSLSKENKALRGKGRVSSNARLQCLGS